MKFATLALIGLVAAKQDIYRDEMEDLFNLDLQE